MACAADRCRGRWGTLTTGFFPVGCGVSARTYPEIAQTEVPGSLYEMTIPLTEVLMTVKIDDSRMLEPAPFDQMLRELACS